MKTPLFGILATLGVAALVSGCGEGSSTSGSASSPPPPPPVTASEAAKKVGAEVTQAVEAAKPQVQEAAKTVQQAVTDAGAAAQQKFNDLVAEVKKLIADGKGTEAAQKLQSAFSGLSLSPEQQKTIDDLKKQAQEALSKKGIDSATKAAGDLLKPKTGN